VATVRRRRSCAACVERVPLQYATVPEWNSHIVGRRGRLHANVLSDLRWGELTRPELSAVLEHAGLGWACKMVAIADVSHAMKALMNPQNTSSAHGARGKAHSRAPSWSVTEASRYTLKDLTDVARHAGRFGRYPAHRRRISSNVVHPPRRRADARFEYSLLKDAPAMLDWFEHERMRDLLDAATSRLAAVAPFRPPGCVCHDDLFCDGGCICGAGELVTLDSRAPP
jgi:hypothetical protein